MSDVVSLEQQSKEELAEIAPPSEGSVLSKGSRRTEQWVDNTRRGNGEEGLSDSIVFAEPADEGCSRTPLDEDGIPNSQNTRGMSQDLTCVGELSYARPRVQEVTRPCANGKHKKCRPPMMNMVQENNLEQEMCPVRGACRFCYFVTTIVCL